MTENATTTLRSTTLDYNSTTVGPDTPQEIPKELIELVVSIAIPVIAGSLVAVSVQKNIDWYQQIKKPDWAPPSWLFGPVWIILYTLIGFASFLVIRTEGGVVEAAVPLLIYFSNLALNFAWSPIFFGLQQIKAALIDIVLIDATAVATAVFFYSIDKTAGWLLVPYLVWLLIATALNYSILILNADSSNAVQTTAHMDNATTSKVVNMNNSFYPSVPTLTTASQA